jgi:macrodomain Ter protein organizer (MatP/YcbG family)
VLERLTPHRPAETDESAESPEPETTRGRGVARADRKSGAAGRARKDVKGRTIYLPESLFERIMVQAHRKGRTISEYVTAILERQVPDYRGARAETTGNDEAA